MTAICRPPRQLICSGNQILPDRRGAAEPGVPHRRRRAGLEQPSPPVWDGVPTQRCTVHKHRNLLAHAHERLHDEISADYTDMFYAATPEEIGERRRAFLRKWRLRHPAVAASLEQAGDKLCTFTRLPPS